MDNLLLHILYHLPVLKPLALTLHGEHAEMVNRMVSKRLSVEAKLCCWIWRAFFILIAIKPEHFARPILSFKTFSSLFRVEYDASLAGSGLIISRLDGEDWKTLKVLSVEFPYLLRRDFSFQNTMEFMAIALAVCILQILGDDIAYNGGKRDMRNTLFTDSLDTASE